MNAFETCALSVRRGSRDVIREVSIKLRVGEVVGVLGPNGAGKSSLLGAMAGELSARSGEVLIDGRSLAGLDALAQARIRAVLPQQAALTFDLALTDVIRMGAYPFAQATPAQVDDWVRQSVLDADLAHLEAARYGELSGGEAQRIQFARVLVQARAAAAATGHASILLDEPTSSLDPRHQLFVMQRVHQLARSENFGVLIVMHDINLAAQWCSRIVLLNEGKVASDAPPTIALTPKTLEQVFGMPMRVLPHPLESQRILVLADVNGSSSSSAG